MDTPQTPEPLTITKTRDYVWRCNLGSAHMGWIEVWNVVTATGEVLEGGCEAGCNVQSGRARLSRKSWATAFIQGWKAFREGRLTEAQASSSWLDPALFPSPRYSEQEQRWFQQGAYRAYRWTHPRVIPTFPSPAPSRPHA